jgi:hypothetical protein
MTVQKSGFGRVCTQICQSKNLVLWKNQHVEDLLRKNRIQDSIRQIQLRWTPPDVIKSWTPRAVEFIGFEIGSRYPLFRSEFLSFSKNCNPRIAGGKELIRAFLQYPTLIPRASYPQSVYFALGQANFTRTWHHYLGAGLHSFGYNVNPFYNILALY